MEARGTPGKGRDLNFSETADGDEHWSWIRYGLSSGIIKSRRCSTKSLVLERLYTLGLESSTGNLFRRGRNHFSSRFETTAALQRASLRPVSTL